MAWVYAARRRRGAPLVPGCLSFGAVLLPAAQHALRRRLNPNVRGGRHDDNPDADHAGEKDLT